MTATTLHAGHDVAYFTRGQGSGGCVGAMHLGPLRAPMRQLIVSAEDQSGLVAELTPPGS